MNKTLSQKGREYLKELLSKCTVLQQTMFKRMYSHRDQHKSIDEVVDAMPDNKIDWAITQCENTVNRNLTNDK